VATVDEVVHSSAPRSGLLFGRFRPWMAMVALVTILAGLLFGYDQGVISGALSFIADDFSLSSTLQEVVTSWVTLGALAGALVAGILADRVGRKRTLLLAGLLFTVGASIQAFAPDTGVLVVGRFVIGVGVGVASVAGPLYAAEMAPKQTRGRFVSSYQLAITIGILVADIVDAAFSASGEWRWMLGLAIVPGLLLAMVVAIMPDTPRWLMKMGRRADASVSLTKTQGRAVAVATAANWAAAFLVSQTFLTLLDAIGEAATFLCLAGMCVVSYVWIERRVPETKGKSLEEIQRAWAEHDRERVAPAAPAPQTD
jgi:MFS family permease